VEIVDRVRDLGWQGVVGNTDEMLSGRVAHRVCESIAQTEPMFAAIGEMAAATREALEKKGWRGCADCRACKFLLDGAGARQSRESMARTGAGGGRCGVRVGLRSPRPAGAVYGHIHRSYIRSVNRIVIVNTGSVSMSYDGDRRAAYSTGWDHSRYPARGI